jgi:predicted nucleotidyltransferase
MMHVSGPYRLDSAAREDIIRRIGAALTGRTDLVFAFVFGSFLEREAFRDVDVGIWTSAQASAGLDLELAQRLSRELEMPVDVRRINDAPTSFLFHVLRGRPLVVRDEAHLAEVMEQTARDYHDRAPLLRRAASEAFAR